MNDIIDFRRDLIDDDHAGASQPIVRLGQLVGWAADGQVTVAVVGVADAPMAARTIIPVGAAAVQAQREVLLVFTPDGQPIVVGLLQPPPSPSTPVASMADGRRLEIAGEDEIVLRCGKASITLRRNGRVVIRGEYVETRATGVNRVKGGTVQIN